MASEEELALYNDMIQKGCCKRCALRYLGFCKTLITFSDPDTCLLNFGFLSPLEAFINEPKKKKQKKNPCVVCLELLEDAVLDQMLSDEHLDKVDEYKSESFVAYITFPSCILVRDHSMKLYLKRTFPKLFDISKVIKVNHAWRYSVEEKLCKKLNKTYDYRSKLILHFYTDYLLENEEMQVVQSFTSNSNKTEPLSKHYVASLLDTIPDETFINFIKSPPKVPFYEIQFSGIKYFSEAIHLMGNYCKYSRELLLTSSLENQIQEQDDSIHAIILKEFKKATGDFKEMLFTASSFDEQSQRVLGHGRTFHLQILDPKFASVTSRQCRQIEREIKKTKVLMVHNLREADKKEIKIVIDSEQLGPRSFKVLCVIYKCKNIDYCVNAVNMYTEITVQQKTPVRLLATREFKKKRKKILFIKAKRVKGTDNLIELNLSTECGLHIPEFINGDFGRTEPSLAEMTKAKVDLLAIDVVDFFPTLPQIAREST